MKIHARLLILSSIFIYLKSADTHENKSNTQKNSVKSIETVHEFQDILKKNDKVIINFFGACSHCAPGREAFNNFVATLEVEDIKFYEFKVNDKPEVLQFYGIESRPCIIAFIKGNPQKLRLIREDIINANLKELIQICSEKQ